MGDFRFGQVASALSSGLGELYQRSAQQEILAANQRWELMIENMRQARADARTDAELQAAYDRQMATNESRERVARINQKTSENIAAASRRQEHAQWTQEQITQMEEALSDRLQAYTEQEEDAVEDVFDPAEKAAVRERYQQLRDQEVISHVMRMMARNQQQPGSIPGYVVNSPRDMAAILSRAGMDVNGAQQYGQRIWESIAPEDPQATIKMPAPGEEAPASGAQQPGAQPGPAAQPGATPTTAPTTAPAATSQEPGAVRSGLGQLFEQSFVSDWWENIRQSGRPPGEPGEDRPYGTNLF